jgi:signal transduction histidine kinase
VTAAEAPLLARRFGRVQLLVIDAALAVAVALLCWYAAIESPSPPNRGWPEPMYVSIVTALGLAAPVAARRRWPLAAVGVSVVVAALSLASGVIPDFAGSAPIVAVGLVLYTVGVDLEARRSATVAFGGIVLIAVAFIYAARSPFEASFATLVLCAPWAVGRTVRERRAYAARAAQQATAMAVDGERLRIAREIHDIVSHSMSLIAVKATIADHVADDYPQEMRAALRVIASTSRAALGDLRLALGALRTEPSFAPAPGLADLAGLAQAAESAGVGVELRVRGDAELPNALAQAVFRIVQEALTNAVKHAGPTRCRVEVDVGPDEVRIEAIDEGPDNGGPKRAPDGARTAGSDDAPDDAKFGLEGVVVCGEHDCDPGDGSDRAWPSGVALAKTQALGAACPDTPSPGARPLGQGLIGMRERVALFDGRFAAGPRQPRGWLVSATLRYER